MLISTPVSINARTSLSSLLSQQYHTKPLHSSVMLTSALTCFYFAFDSSFSFCLFLLVCLIFSQENSSFVDEALPCSTPILTYKSKQNLLHNDLLFYYWYKYVRSSLGLLLLFPVHYNTAFSPFWLCLISLRYVLVALLVKIILSWLSS